MQQFILQMRIYVLIELRSNFCELDNDSNGASSGESNMMRILWRSKYFDCLTARYRYKITIYYTYVAMPLKNVRNRRFVRKIEIAIEHRVLSDLGRKVIRFLVLL